MAVRTQEIRGIIINGAGVPQAGITVTAQLLVPTNARALSSAGEVIDLAPLTAPTDAAVTNDPSLPSRPLYVVKRAAGGTTWTVVSSTYGTHMPGRAGMSVYQVSRPADDPTALWVVRGDGNLADTSGSAVWANLYADRVVVATGAAHYGPALATFNTGNLGGLRTNSEGSLWEGDEAQFMTIALP